MLTEDAIKEVGRRIFAGLAKGGVYASLYDDAGYRFLDGGYVVLKIDGFDLRSSLYPWCRLRDFGFRAVTAAVSDLVAKGVRPLFYAFSLGVEPSLGLEEAEEVLRGIEEALELYGGELLNADTNIGDATWIDVAVMGFSRKPPIPRRGASPGDRVLLPRLGTPYICYHTLYVEHSRWCGDEYAARVCCRPTTPVKLVNILDRHRGCVAASMDISDTVSETLYEIAVLNSVALYIEVGVEKLLTPPSLSYAERHGLDLLEVFSRSYEEYVPVLIVREGCADELLRALHSTGLDYVNAGRVAEGPPKVLLSEGREVPVVRWSSTEASLHSK